MQKIIILNHATEFYVSACEILSNPPEEYKKDVTEAVTLCTEVNKNIAAALAKEEEEQRSFLLKAKESNELFIAKIRELEKIGLLINNSAPVLIGFSERTGIDIDQLLNVSKN